MHVWRGKGAKDRTVYLSPYAKEVLQAWLDVRPQGAETLLCTLQGKPLDTSYARHLLARLGEKAGIPFRLHPHTLRHAGASELLRRGFTLADVQRLLGHSNVSTTSVYLHVFDSDLAAKVAGLG